MLLRLQAGNRGFARYGHRNDCARLNRTRSHALHSVRSHLVKLAPVPRAPITRTEVTIAGWALYAECDGVLVCAVAVN